MPVGGSCQRPDQGGDYGTHVLFCLIVLHHSSIDAATIWNAAISDSISLAGEPGHLEALCLRADHLGPEEGLHKLGLQGLKRKHCKRGTAALAAGQKLAGLQQCPSQVGALLVHSHSQRLPHTLKGPEHRALRPSRG
jgi:hypothetical protein